MMKVVDQDLNGQNCGTEEEESEVHHSHCDTCIKIEKCILQPPESNCCDIVSCELNCGFRFHACKESEHRLLCANEKVPCINVEYGCPVTLLRHQRAKHLEICPASVVTCTMEWNRWPVCSQERQMHVPFHLPNPRAKEGQLDIALALRDQRMLNEWMKVPRSTKRVLRNSLTSRFPPVPLRSQPCNEGDSSSMSVPTPTPPSDADEDSWEFRKAPPGLQSSVCGELYKTMKGKVNEAAAETSVQETAKQKVAENGNVPDVISSEKLENLENICDTACENDSEIVINGKCDQPLCSDFEEEEFPKEQNGTCKKNDNSGESSLHIEENDEVKGHSGNSETCSEEWDSHMCIIENSRPKGTSSTLVPPPPSSSPPMIVSLGLDLTLESITRYQTKPTNMYTFLCAQDFRRDEFTWHYKNVHSDIHGGLNGWLEYRCPLAHYGCMFSLRRFYPTEKGSTIVHNDILESFGVKPHNPCDIAPSVTTASHKVVFNDSFQDGVKENTDNTISVINTQPLILCQLPFEVLRYLCRFLDSFSLCNLALTCRRLREVCCSLLKERGLVVQQWKKCQIGPKIKWIIAYKRWFFSTAFTPVHKWGFEAKDHMSNHLKNCMCFERNVTSRPYFHIFGSTPRPSLEAKLTSKSEEDGNGTCESDDNTEE